MFPVPYLPDILNGRKLTFVEIQERDEHHDQRAWSIGLVSWAERFFNTVHVDFSPRGEIPLLI